MCCNTFARGFRGLLLLCRDCPGSSIMSVAATDTRVPSYDGSRQSESTKESAILDAAAKR
jgi:hypothetical protein